MEEQLQMDAEIVKKLFEDHYEELSRYAFSILKDQEESEDVVQQLFVKLWEKKERVMVTTNVRAYLFRSVYNGCMNEIKKMERKGRHVTEDEHLEIVGFDDATRGVSIQELEQKIELAIQKLPAKCGEVFRLSRSEELSYKEISERLNVSVKTIENHMGKALRIMREEMAEYIPLLLILLMEIG